MNSPLRIGDVARMVAAQLCFVAATGPALIAGMLVRDRLEADIVTTMGVMLGISATATGIGVVLLTRRVRDGFLAGAIAVVVLLFALYFINLLSSLFDWHVG